MTTGVERPTIADGLHERILNEGYGPGAWHGPDLKAAIADVSSETAFWRPGAVRHNIAEIALHHAYCVHSMQAKLSGLDAEPFAFEDDDWFNLSTPRISWPAIVDVVDREQKHLATTVADISAGRTTSPLSESERFDLVLGITCHAVYHAGQVQLIKRLRGDE